MNHLSCYFDKWHNLPILYINLLYYYTIVYIQYIHIQSHPILFIPQYSNMQDQHKITIGLAKNEERIEKESAKGMITFHEISVYS